MGSSNISKSDSDTISNSAKYGDLEIMECSSINDGTTIKRAWIAKKSISLNDRNVNLIKFTFLDSIEEYIDSKLPRNACDASKEYIKNLNIEKPKINIFEIKNEIKSQFKHWAVILELSNHTYINIQFGRNGFSLKEFNETNEKGENILNAILNIWGEEEHPVSFCYLGNANYEYNKLKNYLRKIKDEEIKNHNNNGVAYYNACFKNCQHLACDIEKILFNRIQIWHSFNYYLDDFINNFFPKVNLANLKLKYNEKIYKENKIIYNNNLKKIENLKKRKTLARPTNITKKDYEDFKDKVDKMFNFIVDK